MLEGMMRSALAAADMTPEEVKAKIDDMVRAAQITAATVQRIEARCIRIETELGLNPLDFDEQPEQQEGEENGPDRNGYQ